MDNLRWRPLHDELMYILNDNTQNNRQKLLSKRIGQCYDKTLGTRVLNSPMSPPSTQRLGVQQSEPL